MRVRGVGWSAVLLECTAEQVPAVLARLVQARAAGELAAQEIVPGARTVLLDGVADPAGTAELIRHWPPVELAAGPAAVADSVVIPCRYDGPDLAEVGRHWRVTEDEVVRRHTAVTFRVAFCGFAPGFGYLTGLPAELAVPRRDTPRPRVPAGSVGLAGPYTGVYPTASPGGWLLIGRTELRIFDPDADPPALLRPGDRVRFVAEPR